MDKFITNQENNFNIDDIEIDFNNILSSSFTNDSHFDSAQEAYLHCLSEKGKVDLDFISITTNKTIQEIINDLKGAIFQDPQYYDGSLSSGWKTKDQYLSGNILQKLNAAKEANQKYPGVFENNVTTLNNLLKDMTHVDGEDIYVTIGTPWLDIKYLKEFIKEVILQNQYRANFSIVHDELTGSWTIKNIGIVHHYFGGWYCTSLNLKNNINTTHVFGTARMNAFTIIENTLNQTNIAIYDNDKTYVFDNEGKRVEKLIKVKNMDETLLALDKQKKIISEFKHWIFSDPKRKEEIEEEYAKRFCMNFVREYDGSFLTFPDLNKEVTLFDYQKDAVARMLLSPNTLLAHDVGSGKTYEMIAAAHEGYRMGLYSKNMIVVPNDIVTQWESIYYQMYPQANIYVVNPKDFSPSKRIDTLNNIKNNNYESIIIPYSSFDMIMVSPEYSKEKFIEKIKKLKASHDNSQKATTLVNKKYSSLTSEKYKNKLFKLIGERKEGEIYFDDLGIDRLFLDECHNYKNLPIDTNIHVLGINTQGSDKCYDLKMKTSYIQKQNGGKGLVFASGTPITNSISDIYNIQCYLQEGELELYQLSSFNSWISNFAEKSEKFEIDVDTNAYRMVARFSEYKNLPELAAILSNVATFHHINQKDQLPNYNGPIDVVIGPRDEFLNYMKDISIRADLVRNHQPRLIRNATKDDEHAVFDNMLLITTDGRKAALDMRLVDETISFNMRSKVYECAKCVYEIYQKTNSEKLAQLIFCDVSTPKASFNIYDELKRLLIGFGANDDDISFVHSANTKEKRGQLFNKVQSGKIRILIGSTSKLATGVNVQNKLIAIHHIDVPWRPSDMVQREGRILRPGNTNKEVYIYRYVCKKSFDAYSWQLLEYKQRLIASLFSNKNVNRYERDLDDSVLSYAEVKSLAIGNPLIKEREQIINELNKEKRIQKNNLRKRQELVEKIYDIRKRLHTLSVDVDVLSEETYFLKHCIVRKPKFNSDKEKSDYAKRLYASLANNVGKKLFKVRYRELVLSSAYFEFVEDKQVLFVEAMGAYYPSVLNLGSSPRGILNKLDSYIDEDIYKIYHSKCDELKATKIELELAEKELNKEDEYSERIKELKVRLVTLNEQLQIIK